MELEARTKAQTLAAWLVDKIDEAKEAIGVTDVGLIEGEDDTSIGVAYVDGEYVFIEIEIG